MKIPFISLLLMFQVGVIEAKQELRGSQRNRASSFTDFYYLVSQSRKNEDWCLTAVEGTRKFGNLGLRKCDFAMLSASQVWKLAGDGKFHSKQDLHLCMVVGYSNDCFDGVQMRLANCKFDLTSFSYDGEYIKPVDNEDFCITDAGPHPDSNDIIHAKPCMDQAEYKWSLRPVMEFEVNPSKNQTLPSSLCKDRNCPTGISCDPALGECKSNSELRPCIAIFDQSDYFSDAEIDAKWEAFRAKWKDRPFCLLQPLFPSPGPRSLYIPKTFYEDPKTIFRVVNRDEGNEAMTSDWFDICELEIPAQAGMDFVRVKIDGSFDSMDIYKTVTASEDLFSDRLEETGMAHVDDSRVWERDEWISWCTEKD